MIIKENDFEKARKKILELNKKGEEIIFSSNDDELNRKILEKTEINILLLNQKNRKDFQKQRDSGLNQVLVKLAKKSNTKIGINLDEIIETNPKQKAEILARIKQNIKLCSKNKVQMQFVVEKKENQRNIYDLKSLGLILGMPSNFAKFSVAHDFERGCE